MSQLRNAVLSCINKEKVLPALLGLAGWLRLAIDHAREFHCNGHRFRYSEDYDEFESYRVQFDLESDAKVNKFVELMLEGGYDPPDDWLNLYIYDATRVVVGKAEPVVFGHGNPDEFDPNYSYFQEFDDSPVVHWEAVHKSIINAEKRIRLLDTHAQEEVTPDDIARRYFKLTYSERAKLNKQCGVRNAKLMEQGTKPKERLVILRDEFPQLKLDKDGLNRINRTHRNRENSNS